VVSQPRQRTINMKEYSKEKYVLSSDGGSSGACSPPEGPKTTFPTRRKGVSALFLCLVTLAAATGLGGRGQPGFTFTAVDYPGAVNTKIEGVNPQGDVSGIYYDAQGVSHGFVLSKGVFKSIDHPGAAWTEVRGINPSGEIVGDYGLPGEDWYAYHGFRLEPDGTFSAIQYPGWPYVIPQGILPDGSVLGCYHDVDFNNMLGFVLDATGNYSGLDVAQSMNNGATPGLSQISGLFYDFDQGLGRSYVIQNGVFHAFEVPGSIETDAWGMSPSGAVVGDYEDSANVEHGFLLQNGQFTTIDFPGAQATAARNITPAGVIVGWYADANGNQHGFVASPQR